MTARDLFGDAVPLTEVLESVSLPTVLAQEVADRGLVFYITGARRVNTRYGERIVFEIVGPELIPSALFLSVTSAREEILKYLERHPGAKIGPCVLRRGRRGWVFESAQSS